MALLQSALEGCRRSEELFPAGAVSYGLHPSLMLTKGGYIDRVNDHTGVFFSLREQLMPFVSGWERTRLMLLAP